MGFESRQVIDIEISKVVTEYRVEIVEDAQGLQFIAEFPTGVTRPVQYGHLVKAQSVYMSQQQPRALRPHSRLLRRPVRHPDQRRLRVQLQPRGLGLLETFESIVTRQLIAQPLLHADETGINVNGARLWLHCLSNPLWTCSFPTPIVAARR